jgi:type II secretory pathway component PulF
VQQLSIKEKREFYTGLARLIRSGNALPTALDLMARGAPRRLGDFLHALNTRIKQGEPLGDALLMQRPRVSELEATIVAAAGRSGRLDRGCDQLARYFEALERARTGIKGGLIYPLVMLHLVVLVVNISPLLTVGVVPYLLAILPPLLCVYALAAVLWIGWRVCAEAARTSVAMDKVLRRVPGIGPIRERFALARFFATLDAQLEAQVNIWDAFANAAKTSDSARIINAARAAMPMLQSGERLSEALTAGRVIPEDYLRAFRVAEQTGEMAAELATLAQESEELAVRSLNRWSQWLPKIIYVMVLCYGGWQIVHWYQGYMSAMDKIDPFSQ